MRYKVTINYKRVCPKCKYNLARSSGKTKGGKRKFKCNNCWHVFPEGRTEYNPPRMRCSKRTLQELDDLILELIRKNKIKGIKGIDRKEGIKKEIYPELRKRMFEIIELNKKKIAHSRKAKEYYDSLCVMPSSKTITHRIEILLKDKETFTVKFYDGEDSAGNEIISEKLIPMSRQHY